MLVSPVQLLEEDTRGGQPGANGVWDGGAAAGGGDGGRGSSLEDAVLQSSHHFYRCIRRHCGSHLSCTVIKEHGPGMLRVTMDFVRL